MLTGDPGSRKGLTFDNIFVNQHALGDQGGAVANLWVLSAPVTSAKSLDTMLRAATACVYRRGAESVESTCGRNTNEAFACYNGET